ncbi:RNA polymerase sigma factor [Kribbella sp. WER1]
MSNHSPPGHEARFVALFEATYDDLVRFAHRRVPEPQAEDIVAEAFLVAWRRPDELPPKAADARAWLFGIARNVILNTHRGARRQLAVAVRLAETVPSALDDDAELVARQVDLARAWGRLTDVHQETLALSVLDDLTAPQAAAVLLPSSLGGDQAFATWTATPSGLTGKARLDASKACRNNSDDTYKKQLATARTAIAERRGAWTLVVLADNQGFGALCITDRSRHLFRDQFGAIGTTSALPTPRALTPITLGTGSSNGNDLSVITGLAGKDVAAVSYASTSHGKVAANVDAGQFALWFPGDELVNANRTGVPVQVTYTDGTSATLTLEL